MAHENPDEMARQYPDTMRQSHRIGVQFLMAEIQTASVFLEVAETTSRLENRRRNIGNARTAYQTVIKLLPHADPVPSERHEIEVQLERLKQRLMEAESKLQP